MVVVGVLGVVSLTVLVVDSRTRVTEGERFLQEKDALIAEFRGFLDRAEQLEEECHGALESVIPDLTAHAVREAERRADVALGEQKLELLKRRRAELFVLFAPDPDSSRASTEKRRGRLQASEKQWRALYLELHELRLRELNAVAQEIIRKRAARMEAVAKEEREAPARRSSRQRDSATAEVVRTKAPAPQSAPPTPAEVRAEPAPRKASKDELFVKLIDGVASEDDVLRYEAMVFPDGVQPWAEELRSILRQEEGVATPKLQAIEALATAAESGGDQGAFLIPYVLRAVESGVDHPRLRLNAAELLCLPSSAHNLSRAARLAEDLAGELQAGVDPKMVDRFAMLLDRVPAGDRFGSRRECAKWMASALRAGAERLRSGTPLEQDWLLHERHRQLEKDYVAAVRAGDQKAILQCATVWEALDARDPTPHLLAALTLGSFSSSGASNAKAHAAASKFERLCGREDDPSVTHHRMQQLGLLAVLDQLKLPRLDLPQALKLPVSGYAFPERSILEIKIVRLEQRVLRLDDEIAKHRVSIKKLRRQLSRVSPNDRRYILDVKVPEHEDRIRSREKEKVDKQALLELARGALRRMQEFSIR